MIYYMINILLALYFILLYFYCISIQPLADIWNKPLIDKVYSFAA